MSAAPDILIELASPVHVRATVRGRYIGEFRSELDARRGILRELEARYGLVPKDGAGAYLHNAETR